MNLIVDIGNTRTKIAFVEDNNIQEIQYFDFKNLNLKEILHTYAAIPTIVSSVNHKIDFELPSRTSFLLFFDSKTALPIKNNYKSEKIGMDRIASAIEGYYLFPKKNCLILDFGSAITIDFLNREGIYMGGNISPGLKFRFKSLNNFTANLPLVDEIGEVVLTSNETNIAIRSGVVKSIIFEIKGYIKAYEKRYSDLQIIFTGGDAKYFAKQFKNPIFVDSNLVVKGLNRILNYNVDKK